MSSDEDLCGPNLRRSSPTRGCGTRKARKARDGGEGVVVVVVAPWTRLVGAKESCLKQAFKVCKPA